MFNTRGFSRILKRAVALPLIVATVSLLSAAQSPAGATAHQVSADLAARDELSEGVEAYKAARYDEAIAHFQRAADLDPNLPFAKVYLATAVAQNVVPGLDTKENLKTAERAIEVFQEVLVKDPHDINSMKQVAGILYNIKKLEEAKDWQMNVLAEDPKDPDAAYTVAVIDWSEAHQNVLGALQPSGLNDDGEGNLNKPAEAMRIIQTKNAALVEEALKYLHEALENRPDYPDAMAYLNLVYRRKADLDRDNEAARKDDLAKANEWSRKAIETRKAKEEKSHAQPNPAQP